MVRAFLGRGGTLGFFTTELGFFTTECTEETEGHGVRQQLG